jgi:hypothetical protein
LPRRAPRSWLVATASLIVAGTFAFVATAAAGLEPGRPTPIPQSAFRPVSLPSPVLGPTVAPAPTSSLPPLAYPWLATALPGRPQPQLDQPKPIVVVIPAPGQTAEAAPRHSISGAASWYCRAGWSPCTVGFPDVGGVDAYAAAGPALRAAIGKSWRGKVVTVDGLRVKLIDWCQCHRGEPNEKLLDLYYDVFARKGSNVVVRW